MTVVAERFALRALDEKVLDSIPGRTDLGYELF